MLWKIILMPILFILVIIVAVSIGACFFFFWNIVEELFNKKRQ